MLLATFASYVAHVEPDAAADPVGAVVRATDRLATICQRNAAECEFVHSTASVVYRAGEMGFGLATGNGRLVYVTSAQSPNLPGESGTTGWSGGSATNTGAGILDLPYGQAGPSESGFESDASSSSARSGSGFSY